MRSPGLEHPFHFPEPLPAASWAIPDGAEQLLSACLLPALWVRLSVRQSSGSLKRDAGDPPGDRARGPSLVGKVWDNPFPFPPSRPLVLILPLTACMQLCFHAVTANSDIRVPVLPRGH